MKQLNSYNLKSALLFLMFNIMVLFGFAQKVPYEKLDSLSKMINNIQFATNEMSYNDGKMDYELSFPEANFMVTFHDQLAVKSVYKKWDGKEVLALTENIDLSKAIGITVEEASIQVFVVRLYFPKGSLRTQIFENGKLVNTLSEEYLEFFCIDKVENINNLFYSLSDLCANLKIAKGLITKAKVLLQEKDWKAVSLYIAIKVQAPAMVLVEGGTFTMGSEYGEANEKPVHQVTVSSFYMGKYEVTQAQWLEVMGNNPSMLDDCSNCPVDNVSWDDVQQFLVKLNAKTGKNYRLPTEAEWEYAAHGGQNYTYAGSNKLGEVAWYYDNGEIKTHPVGQKLANGYGLYDMTGNVSEWCSDWWSSYSNSPSTNPKGSSSANHRVIRGGSFGRGVAYSRLTRRDSNKPGDHGPGFGFRMVVPE